MGNIHGGRIVTKYLKEFEGIDTLFSISGGHIVPIYDGCLDLDVKVIDVRHEQAAVMAAHAWSIYKDRPGVCLVTAGPGFTNSLTGVVNAHQGNAPVVILGGMAPIRDLDKGALQDINQLDMIKPVTKWTGRCHETGRIPEYLEMAFRHAVSGRPGPTYLELPPDVLYREVDEDEVVYPAAGSRKYRAVPDEESIEEAAALIDSAEKPLLVGGSGVGFSSCADELNAFVERTGIPFVLANNGRGTIPDDHPLSLWDGGLMGILAAGSMADLVLSVGIRYNWYLNYGEPLANAKVIRLDIDPAEINRNVMADVGLVGDAGATLGLLNQKVKDNDHGEWLETLKAVFDNLTATEKQQAENPSDPIHPIRLIHQLREAAGDEPINIIDGGDTIYFGLTGLRAKEKAGVLGYDLLFGCLGVGVPYAIGAKLARPDERVVLVTGDGAFGLNAMELETAARHCLPIVCVINNDQGWGMVKHHQELCYDTDRVCGTELGVVHYEKIAEAMGCHGEFVTKDEEIVPAIQRAMDSGKPACVNVLTDTTVTSPATVMMVEDLNTLK